MVFPLGRGTFTGVMLGSVFCTLGQVPCNEMGAKRLKFSSRRYPIPSQPPTLSTVSGLAEPSVPKTSLLDRMIHAIGIKRLSDEEYLAQMREKRAAYLQRLEKLETQPRGRRVLIKFVYVFPVYLGGDIRVSCYSVDIC